jgi:type II secretory pathway component PulF
MQPGRGHPPASPQRCKVIMTQDPSQIRITPVSPSAGIVLFLMLLAIGATAGTYYAVVNGLLIYASPFTAADFDLCSTDLQVYCNGITEMLVTNGQFIPVYGVGVASTFLFFIVAMRRLNRLGERTHTLRMMIFGPLLMLGAWHFAIAPFWEGNLNISEWSNKMKTYLLIGGPMMVILGLMVLGHSITFIRQILLPGREEEL